MTINDEEARKAKAKQLREQIDALKAPDEEVQGSESQPAPAGPQNARDWIHEQMRKRDKEGKEKS